jgi:hypothetical protein
VAFFNGCCFFDFDWGRGDRERDLPERFLPGFSPKYGFEVVRLAMTATGEKMLMWGLTQGSSWGSACLGMPWNSCAGACVERLEHGEENTEYSESKKMGLAASINKKGESDGDGGAIIRGGSGGAP